MTHYRHRDGKRVDAIRWDGLATPIFEWAHNHPVMCWWAEDGHAAVWNADEMRKLPAEVGWWLTVDERAVCRPIAPDVFARDYQEI
jgi:hypothetical protein